MRVKSALLIGIVFLLIGGSLWLFLKGGKETTLLPASSPLVVQPKDGFSKLVQRTPSCLDESKPLEYIIGIFRSWEEIQNSPDKYLLLASRQTGELLPKVRVVLDSNPTSFLVMEINEGNLTENGETTFSFATRDTTFDEFDRLVQPEGVVKAFLRKQADQPCNLKDENEFFLADKIYLMQQR